MNTTQKVVDFKTKSADESSGIIEGYAAVFGNIDSYGDIIEPGAFTESLAALNAAGKKIPLLYNHLTDLGSHVGVVIEALEDERGLLVRCQLDMDDLSGQRVYNLIKSGRIKDMSFAFRVLDGADDTVDNQPVYRITKLELIEVSVVMMGANPEAKITSVKAAPPGGFAVSPEIVAKSAASDSQAKLVSTLFTDLDDQTLYLSELLKSKDSRALLKSSMKLDEQTAAFVEQEAVKALVDTAAERKSGLTTEQLKQIELIRDLPNQRQKARANQDLFRRVGALGKAIEDDRIEELDKKHADDVTYRSTSCNRKKESSIMSNKLALPTSTKSRATVADRAVTDFKQKADSGLAATGQLVVPLTVETDIQQQGSKPTTILDILPTYMQATPAFTYLRQTVRELKAGIVPTGTKKPESNLGFERVNGELAVVAHLVKHVDEYMLEDVNGLRNFISSEMISGVMEKVEAWLVNVLAGATGAQTAPFKEDGFTTARLAKSKLETLGLDANAFILNPEDWALMETAKATGSGTFLFNAAPVDQTHGLLWGVPVVTSPRVPQGNGFAINSQSVAVRTDGRLKFEWNRTGEDFDYNHITFRAEGRFAPTVTRGPGIVQMLLTTDAAAIKPDPAEAGDVTTTEDPAV